MALIINTNIASLNAQRNLAANTSNLDRSVQRLSSGLRINSARDDAAGLAISEQLRADIRSMAVAIRNAQDGISLSQTAEGGLQEIGSILIRMRELAQQSASGTINDRTPLTTEFKQLQEEIIRIAAVTEFNGTSLLDGSLSGSGVDAGIALQVGLGATLGTDTINVNGINQMNTVTLGVDGDIADADAARLMLGAVDFAISEVSNARGNLGAIQNRLDSTISNLRVSSENLQAADSRIRDADFALETAIFTKNQILVQAATSVLAQANVLPQQALTLLR